MRFSLGHRLPGGFWGGVSTYARRPHRGARQAAHATGGIGCVGFIVLVVVLALSITYWYISVPVVVLTAVAVGITVHRQHLHRAPGTGPVATARPVIAAPPLPEPASPPREQRAASTPPLTVPADTFKVGSLVHLEKSGRRATYFVDHGRTPDEIVLKRVTSTPPAPDA
ncbi:MAG: hypothetical protein WAW53_12860 [Candidatus Dormiibacterota bacterium]